MDKRYLLLVGGVLTVFGAVQAQAGTGGVSTGVKAGTLGAGLEVGVGLNEWCGLRLGANALQFSMNETIDNIDYDADLRLQNISALLDVYPFQGIFRLTGGILYNGNEFDLEGSSTIPAVINGNPYTPEQLGVIKGTAEFNTWAPYLGLGWNSRPEQQAGWGVAFDMGILFQGSPKVSSLTATGAMAGDPQLVADLEQERGKVQEELDKFQYYPVVSFMVHYNF